MPLRNPKAKGSRAEYRTMRMLEAIGYSCRRVAGSHGEYDVIAIAPHGIRLVQVKCGGEYCSAVDREVFRNLLVPANVAKEIWRLPDRCKAPLIEVL